MAAGLGFKTFTTGEVLTAADTNGYLMQGINVFANAAARTAAITSPQEGQYSYLKDTNALEYYDGAAWVGAPVGDITAVTAGKGLTGGGSSGDVTVSLATTAKGDLVAGSGASTAAVLTVGTNGQVLTANSSTATGLEYAPNFGSSISIQRGTSNQTITANAWTKIQLNSEDWDSDSSYDPTTNFRFTPKVAGYYQFNTMIYQNAQTAPNLNNYAIYQNGGFACLVDLDGTEGPKGRPTILKANGTTDYFEWYLYAPSTNGTIVNRSGGSPTTVTWLRSL